MERKEEAEALSLESGGIARVGVKALARRDSELALRLGWLGMQGSESERAAGKALAKEGLLEEANRLRQGSQVGAAAFAELCREGDLAWGQQEPMRQWARRNAEKIAPLCEKREIDALEAAYPGYLESLRPGLAAEFAWICEGLIARGKMKGALLEGMLAEGGGPKASASAALCAKRIPEEMKAAWGRLLIDAGKPRKKGERAPMIAWTLVSSWGRMGKEEAVLAAEGLASAMAESRSLAALAVVSAAVEALGDRNAPESAERGASDFLETLARECAGREIGKRALPSVGPRHDLIQGSLSSRRMEGATAQAQKLAEMPVDWVFKEGVPGAASIRERMALAWWRGWSDGGGEAPGIRVLLGRSAREGLGGARYGIGALAAALGARGRMEAARWLLLEGGAGAVAAGEARWLAGELERIGGKRMPQEMEALLEAAALSGSAEGAKRKSGPARRL